jgi:hypothetical protein
MEENEDATGEKHEKEEKKKRYPRRRKDYK